MWLKELVFSKSEMSLNVSKYCSNGHTLLLEGFSKFWIIFIKMKCVNMKFCVYEGMCGRGGTAWHVLNLRIRWRWVCVVFWIMMTCCLALGIAQFWRDVLPPCLWQLGPVYFSKIMVPSCQVRWWYVPTRPMSVKLFLTVFIDTFSEYVVFIVEHFVNKMFPS